jgi:hypothetical protein
MTAGEDQTEAIILDLLFFVRRIAGVRLDAERKISLRSIEARPSAHPVDGLEACRRNQPRARLVRNASLRPGLQSSSERLVHRLFGVKPVPHTRLALLIDRNNVPEMMEAGLVH